MDNFWAILRVFGKSQKPYVVGINTFIVLIYIRGFSNNVISDTGLAINKEIGLLLPRIMRHA